MQNNIKRQFLKIVMITPVLISLAFNKKCAYFLNISISSQEILGY